ncbi:MAG TPA: rRNA maturation RNase YbeY [Pyrinomonadaceae bacterium]|nr:rRNA maturation RNase YbeY [Pyrinomonadaceae bacterium]
MIEVVNRQRRRYVDAGRWKDFVGRALQAIGRKDEGAAVVFVSDRAMRDLNRRFRGRDVTTDVLSFPAGQTEFEKIADANMGDVVISLERAEAQAAEHGLGFEEEVSQLILHGLLHLCGYDHETDNGEMNRLELRLRRRLGI